MSDIRSAFETVVVGILAVPWVLLSLHLLLYALTGKRLLPALWTSAREHETDLRFPGAIFVGICYFLGSAIFPLADEVFNEPEKCLFVKPFGWIPLQELKSDDQIRVETYQYAYFPRATGARNSGKVGFQLQPLDYPQHLHNTAQQLVQVLPEWKSRIEIPDRLLCNLVHSVYNHQKYAVYHDEKGARILESFYNQIILLRGTALDAVLVSWTLLIALLLLALQPVLKWVGEKKGLRFLTRWTAAALKKDEMLLVFAAFLLSVFLSCLGIYGLNEMEREFNKHVIGLYHGGLSQKIQNSATSEKFAESSQSPSVISP